MGLARGNQVDGSLPARHTGASERLMGAGPAPIGILDRRKSKNDDGSHTLLPACFCSNSSEYM